MQQGCYYKHEMPDRETLENIGFRHVPRWWQEHLAAANNVEDSCRDGKGLGRQEELSGVWAKSRQHLATEEDTASEGASSSEIPLGNPDTDRWTRRHLANSATPPKAPRKEHIIGKAQPPASVPVCGPVSKAKSPNVIGHKRWSAVLHQPLTEDTDLITMDMPPLLPTPPSSEAVVSKTPANSPVSEQSSPTSLSIEPGKVESATEPTGQDHGASTASLPKAPSVRGRGGTKSAITQQVERLKQREKQRTEQGQEDTKGKVSGPGKKRGVSGRKIYLAASKKQGSTKS